MTTELAFVNAAAAEIDRLVVRGHELAHAYPDKPPAVADLTALPHLLSTAAIALLAQPLSREAVKRILPYTPPSMIDALIDNNVSEGVVTEQDGTLTLTESGRTAAEGVVSLQEISVADAWSGFAAEVEMIESVFATVVEHGKAIEPPSEPSNFALFAQCCERPSAEGRVLRLITAVRYWRADAHLRALDDADLRPNEAHALNRLWDEQRALERVGQGFPDPGRRAVSSLEERGLVNDGALTADAVRLREQIEDETDRLTAPIYADIDEPSRERLVAALQALPGEPSPGVPGT